MPQYRDGYYRRQSRGRLSQVGPVGREQNIQFWRGATDWKRAAEAEQIEARSAFDRSAT
jgi:hypothetical protein